MYLARVITEIGDINHFKSQVTLLAKYTELVWKEHQSSAEVKVTRLNPSNNRF